MMDQTYFEIYERDDIQGQVKVLVVTTQVFHFNLRLHIRTTGT